MIVLVTGCHGGIGSSICNLFKSNSWIVVGTDLTSHNNTYLDHFIKCNLEITEDRTNLFTELAKITNNLDCLVNNAAYQICGSFLDLKLEDFRKVMECNLIAPLHLIQLSISLLEPVQGNVINIASVHSLMTSSDILAYATSKAGLAGMTKNLAIECANKHIRVNAISPGAINTPMLVAGLERNKTDETKIDLLNKLGKKHPIGRVGEPLDIANLVLFLGDNSKSSFITGANYVIDGGCLTQLSTENYN